MRAIGLVVVGLVAGLAGLGAGHAGHKPNGNGAIVTGHHIVSTVGVLDGGELTSEPEDLGELMPEMVIVGHAPKGPKATSPVAWVCGPVEGNLVGGSQRTCEWVSR